MDVFFFSFNGVFPLILIVSLGLFLKRIHIYDDTFIQQANRFCFLVAFPLQLFYNIYHIDFNNKPDGLLILFIICSITILVVLLSIIVPCLMSDKTKQGAFIQGAYRSNFLLIGLPLAKNLFGDSGVAVASLALPVVVPIYNFFAVVVLTLFANREGRSSDIKAVPYLKLSIEILKNPLIIASVLGLILGSLHIPIPVFLDRAVGDVGSIATPLALILLGGQFSFSAFHGRLKAALFASFLRVIGLPFLVLCAAIYFGFRDIELSTILIIFASPSAISGFIMAKNMDNDAELAGQIIVLSTIFSSITLFIWVFVFRYLGLI